MRIKELEEKTGLTRHTIRFYEKQGFLGEHLIHREGNNYRDYPEEMVTYLLMLKAGQAAGFTLAELKELITADEANELSLQRKGEHIRQKMREIEKKKAELEHIHRFLAYKLSLLKSESTETSLDGTYIIPEMLTAPSPNLWNVCLSRLKGEQPMTLFSINEEEGKTFEDDSRSLS
ncbi:MerR family transcriptional regulator [Ktedonospora formicarum]|uniref:HTH merR-type domain-containing protein n=1 Tax=Ktedonospora formicarum TaxID=2778364 RepID=A0A8J3MTL3_9CHLR|nr:MerR family transcriptional regulator [Ktedonospora formicarum]GHO46046.1 hypothetical protein KSX_42090 [Ktedonospora formicarum]